MRAAEFFAGIGLVRAALEEQGWDVVFANDVDPRKLSIYKQNFDPKDFHLGDIRNIKPENIPSIDLATASFPCIDLSLAGNRAGLKGVHSGTFWEFARIIQGMKNRQPLAIIIENVLGLLTSNHGNDLKKIVQSLNEMGYLCDLVVVDAAHFVPQSRQRLFIIGKHKSYVQPSLLFNSHPARSGKIKDFIIANPDLMWSLSELPKFPERKLSITSILQKYRPTHPIWWNKKKQNHIYTQMAKPHRVRLKNAIKQSKTSFLTVYKRVRNGYCRAELRDDGLAGCLRTPRGGSSKQFVIQAGFGGWKVRNMIAAEYAKLQGAPEDYQFLGSENDALLGFGDAVCVPAVEWVIDNCLHTWLKEVSVAS